MLLRTPWSHPWPHPALQVRLQGSQAPPSRGDLLRDSGEGSLSLAPLPPMPCRPVCLVCKVTRERSCVQVCVPAHLLANSQICICPLRARAVTGGCSPAEPGTTARWARSPGQLGRIGRAAGAEKPGGHIQEDPVSQWQSPS